MSADLSAAILAGGAASRLGGRKHDALVGGRTMLGRAFELARSLSDDVLLLPAARLDVRAPAGEVRVLADAPGSPGPLGALRAALAGARHEWCLVLACDLPLLRAPLLSALAARRAEAGRALAIVPVSATGRQPLCALWHREALPALDVCARAGRFSLRAALDALAVLEVPVGRLPDGERGLRNVNTRADLRRARGEAA